MASHHPAKFGGHRHYGSRDIMVLSRDLARPFDFLVEYPKISHHPSKLGDHKHCVSGDITLLVCHVISDDHVIKLS